MIEGSRILRFLVSGISKIFQLVRMLIQVLLCRCLTAMYKADFTLRWMFRWVRFKSHDIRLCTHLCTCAHLHAHSHIWELEHEDITHTHMHGLLSCWLGWERKLYDKGRGWSLALCATTTCQLLRIQNLSPTTEFCYTLGWWEQILRSLRWEPQALIRMEPSHAMPRRLTHRHLWLWAYAVCLQSVW